MEIGHYASQSNISAYMRLILITRSIYSQLPRAVTAVLFQRQASLGLACVRQWGEVSMNRTSDNFIPLCSASVPTKSKASHLSDYITCWPSPSENWRRSNRKDRDFDPIPSPWKLAISISISMIVTALESMTAHTFSFGVTLYPSNTNKNHNAALT